MFLTLQDWHRYPTARIHYETKNKSFLKLANAYKNKFGIKNHAFLCVIIHPELANVDPHDPNLDQKTIAMIYREVQLNPFYAVRECVRVPPKGSIEPVMFEANRGNIALLWCYFMHMTYISIQPRQTGKSVGLFVAAGISLALYCKNTTINLYTKDDKLRGESVVSIKELISFLPKYLNPKSKRDPDNKEEIRFTDKRINNTLLTHLPQANPKMANNCCRGTAAPIFLGDEIPFGVNSHISIPAALAAGNRARQNAKKDGQLYSTVFTTTAGKLDDKEGAAMYARLSASAEWNEAFLDARDPEDLRRLVDLNRRPLDSNFDTGPAINGTFNHRQVGVSDEVHYENIQLSGGDVDSINRDYFNIWSSGGRSNPLSNDVLAEISLSEVDPTYSELTPSGIIIKWYMTKEELNNWPEDHKMILGVDTSNAVGSDSCTGTFQSSQTLETLGTFNFNKGSLVSFIFGFLGKMMVEKPYVVLIPENKINGQVVIDGVVDVLENAGIDPYRRIFNGIVQKKDDDNFKDLFKEISKPIYMRKSDTYSKAKKHFGFITAGSGEQSRSKLYGDVLEVSTTRCKTIIRDRILSREIKAITVKNGRLDHPDGSHDDQLISWLLSNWLIMYGRNLEFYGIDTDKIRIKENKPLTKQEAFELYKEKIIKEQIEELKELIKVTEDQKTYERLKVRLQLISKQINEEAVITSISSFLRQMEDEYTQRQRAKIDLSSPIYKGYGGRTYFKPEYRNAA